MRRVFPALLTAVTLAACGSHPPTAPSTTTPPPSSGGSSAAPTVAIDVKADAAGSRDAIASLSEIIVDVSGSSGTGLTFTIDFGDGATAATATAKHVYAAPATYTITATVADTQGRKASDTRQIAVRDVTGNWFQAQYIERTKRVEVRRLTIDAQAGTTVRGSYRVTGDADRSFTGTLSPPRSVRLDADRSTVLEGTLPGRLNDQAELWTLLAHGDTADGQRLDFRAITGPPDGAPPDADLRTFMDGGGLGGQPFASLTPVRFDGAASRGTDLTYFIEVGDGTVSVGPQVTRILETYGTARLTVVDRFGRSDAESITYYPIALGGFGISWYGGAGPGTNLGLSFTQRNGVNYTGNSWSSCYPVTPECPSFNAAFTATLSGVRTIRVAVPARGVTYEGTVDWSPNEGIFMTLVQSGGTQNGVTWKLRYHDSY